MAADEFEQLVSECHEALYRFAFSLTRTEADACDLTQQTFYIWATKGHQLRDRSKVKSWLFTILHRQFLSICKRAARFPHLELNEASEELPVVPPEVINKQDAARVLEFLGQLHEPYRAALSLFYLDDYSYKEIADILEVPLGTVRSRISRGIAQLQQAILMGTGMTSLRKGPEAGTTEPRPQALKGREVRSGNSLREPRFVGVVL
jgi:RNA polymerase sigma factor (sigma-70 family)